jgi:hypothetical protein
MAVALVPLKTDSTAAATTTVAVWLVVELRPRPAVNNPVAAAEQQELPAKVAKVVLAATAAAVAAAVSLVVAVATTAVVAVALASLMRLVLQTQPILKVSVPEMVRLLFLIT